MSVFNVQQVQNQRCGYLLQWINLERADSGKLTRLSSFEQVMEQDFLYEILRQVDIMMFDKFSSLTTKKKIDIVEKYLDKQFGKRVKWVTKQSWGDFRQSKNIIQFSKLVCFLSIHSKKKNEIINRILSLTEQAQNYLMQQMKQMQIKLQNITEIKQIKQIIQQIQYYQRQNEYFQDKIKEMAKVNSYLLELLKQTETQNKQLKTQIQKYRKQKLQVFTALNIDNISEYLLVCNKLREQNDKYLDLIKQSQLVFQNYQRNINQFQDRAKNDYLLINNLTDQIAKLKEIHNEKNEQYQYQWLNASANKFNIIKSTASNKENLSKCSTSWGKSAQIPAQWVELAQNQDLDNNQKFLIRSHNGQLLVKLQTMYNKYTQLNKQTQQLRESNKKLTKSNNRLKQILKQIEITHNEFHIQYKHIENQDRIKYERLAIIQQI